MKKLFAIGTIVTFMTAVASAESDGASTNTSVTRAPNTLEVAAKKEDVAAANGQTTGVSATMADPTADETFSAAFRSQVYSKANELNYGSKQAKIDSVNYIAGSYRADKQTKFTLRQYFGYNRNPADGNQSQLLDPVVMYSHTFNGFWKSEPVAADFWYYVPVSGASRDEMSNGKLRADIEWDWTLNPKWIVGYYINPRQSFVPHRMVPNTDPKTVADNPFNELTSITTWIHNAALYYNISDTKTLYFYLGSTNEWRTKDITLQNQTFDTAIGSTMTFGKFILTTEIDNNYGLKEAYAAKPGTVWSAEDNLTYLVQADVTF